MAALRVIPSVRGNAGSGPVRVKICGVRSLDDLLAVSAAGASYAGFNFYPASPRAVTPDQARAIAGQAPVGLAKVALVVDADDATLDTIVARVPLDMLQLHGAESPQRVAELRRRHGLPIMKVVGLSGPDDLAAIDHFCDVADQILVDAKPPVGAVLPGGNGLRFDWRLVAGRTWRKPWMLAGGLTADNVAEAVRLTGTRQVDVASGVESAPGVKDAQRIADFCRAAMSGAVPA